MNRKYKILLDDLEIGTTQFENADPPMGVVFGKISFSNNEFGYKFLSDYCKSENILVNEDDPAKQLIITQSIDALKVVNEEGVEIKGEGAGISGMEEDGFEIEIIGIAYPFYDQEFPHHRDIYESQFE